VDVLQALKYLQSKGAVLPNARMAEIHFGWEICSTVGQEIFRAGS
jgi:hypothetical protein